MYFLHLLSWLTAENNNIDILSVILHVNTTCVCNVGNINSDCYILSNNH